MISHIMEGGLGLRQLCDWAVYVNRVDLSGRTAIRSAASGHLPVLSLLPATVTLGADPFPRPMRCGIPLVPRMCHPSTNGVRMFRSRSAMTLLRRSCRQATSDEETALLFSNRNRSDRTESTDIPLNALQSFSSGDQSHPVISFSFPQHTCSCFEIYTSPGYRRCTRTSPHALSEALSGQDGTIFCVVVISCYRFTA